MMVGLWEYNRKRESGMRYENVEYKNELSIRCVRIEPTKLD